MAYKSRFKGSTVDERLAAVPTKQDVLVSGVNIKTVNGQSIVGPGDAPVTISVPFDVSNIALDYPVPAEVFAAINKALDLKAPLVFVLPDGSTSVKQNIPVSIKKTALTIVLGFFTDNKQWSVQISKDSVVTSFSVRRIDVGGINDNGAVVSNVSGKYLIGDQVTTFWLPSNGLFDGLEYEFEARNPHISRNIVQIGSGIDIMYCGATYTSDKPSVYIFDSIVRARYDRSRSAWVIQTELSNGCVYTQGVGFASLKAGDTLPMDVVNAVVTAMRLRAPLMLLEAYSQGSGTTGRRLDDFVPCSYGRMTAPATSTLIYYSLSCWVGFKLYKCTFTADGTILTVTVGELPTQ